MATPVLLLAALLVGATVAWLASMRNPTRSVEGGRIRRAASTMLIGIGIGFGLIIAGGLVVGVVEAATRDDSAARGSSRSRQACDAMVSFIRLDRMTDREVEQRYESHPWKFAAQYHDEDLDAAFRGWSSLMGEMRSDQAETVRAVRRAFVAERRVREYDPLPVYVTPDGLEGPGMEATRETRASVAAEGRRLRLRAQSAMNRALQSCARS